MDFNTTVQQFDNGAVQSFKAGKRHQSMEQFAVYFAIPLSDSRGETAEQINSVQIIFMQIRNKLFTKKKYALIAWCRLNARCNSKFTEVHNEWENPHMWSTKIGIRIIRMKELQNKSWKF